MNVPQQSRRPRTARDRPTAPAPVLAILSTPETLAEGQQACTLRPGESVTVGRSDEATITLRDGRVSRTHITVTLEPDGRRVMVGDSSANGTTLNGRPVKSAVVEDGDVLRVGDTFLIVRFEPSNQPDAEVPSLSGEAPSVRALRHAIELAGPTDAVVLIEGESGTGKELAARALHAASGRAGPFVAVDCGAIPEELAESLLFGHRAGAFPGATGDAEGLFGEAEGGTLFLEEINELPLEVQPLLLRALESGSISPIGATSPVPVDARVVAASDQDLAELVGDGDLRADLYARLTEVVLRTTPLRERREDILPILVATLGEDAPPLAADLVGGLLGYHWPYNVRELLKVAKELRLRGAGAERLELALVAARLKRRGDVIETEETAVMQGTPPPSVTPEVRQEKTSDRPPPNRDELVAILKQSRGNISQVSRETGRSRRQVYRYLEEHGLNLDDFREE